MKRVLLLFAVATFLVLASCSKNDNESGGSQPTDPDYGYIPFYPGNYWIYEHFKIDSLGNETLQDVYDSVVITGTTTINSLSYYVFQGTFMSGVNDLDTVMILRDSAGYYVDPSGNIHMADNNFTDTLSYTAFTNNNTGDTLYQSWYKMEEEPGQATVEAGVFETVNYMGTILTHNPAPGVDSIRYKDQLYSRNSGQVLDTYFYLGAPLLFERRLIKYYVDENSVTY